MVKFEQEKPLTPGRPFASAQGSPEERRVIRKIRETS
jgi:hypothetical protein